MPSENLTPNLYNKTLTTHATQYTQVLSAQCKYFTINLQDTTSKLYVAFVTGKVATPTAPFFLLSPGQSYSSPEKTSCGAITLYLASDVDGAIAQIVEWADIIS